MRYARELLDAALSSNITPGFDAMKAHHLFSMVYQADTKSFIQPDWMPSPPPPEVQMDCSPFTASEILRVMKKMKAASAPAPFDRIGYVVFKKCSALIPTLVDIFSFCCAHSAVPHQWKTAAIKLITKGSAVEDASNPSNFRPITLTSCIGKIFTTLLRNRWLKFMLLNKYFDTSIQKAFMPSIPGCTEHQLKLCSVLSETQSKHKALAVCWLDIANAYGSVHHSLIQFALQHYHAPLQFLSIVQALYSELNATVITESLDTPLISLQKGMYQGDPLSVVIFNTVMNTLVDTITTRIDLRYQLSGSLRRVNILQYADDTIYKKLQLSRQTQFLTSRDSCVRFLADKKLKHDLIRSKQKFRPAIVAREVLEVRSGGGRKALAKAAKALVAEKTNSGHVDHWKSLERQGHMSLCMDQECAHVWAAVVKALPEDQMKFALNAALDVLPHNSNLHLWKKKNSPAYTLCGGNKKLLHVLNNCTTARDLQRYNSCHDLVLQDIASDIKPHLSATTTLSVEIGEGYQFPCCIVSTDLRPAIVWWDFSDKSVCFTELMVCFETNFMNAAVRKTTKYTYLIRQARSNGYRATLLTLQVGARGVPH